MMTATQLVIGQRDDAHSSRHHGLGMVSPRGLTAVQLQGRSDAMELLARLQI